MTNAPRDNNFIPGKLAVLNTDIIQGTHLIPIAINESNGGIRIDTSAIISFTMQPLDPRDQNYVGCWCFEGSDGHVYPAVATSDGNLLIDM